MAESVSRAVTPRPALSIDAEVYDLFDTPYPTDAMTMITQGLCQGAVKHLAKLFLTALPREIFADIVRLPAMPIGGVPMADVRRAVSVRPEIVEWLDKVCDLPWGLVFVPVRNEYGDVPCHWVPALAFGCNNDADLVETHLVDAGLDALSVMTIGLMNDADKPLLDLIARDDVIVDEIRGPGLDRLLDLRLVKLVWKSAQPMFHARVCLSELGQRVADAKIDLVPDHIKPIVESDIDNLTITNNDEEMLEFVRAYVQRRTEWQANVFAREFLRRR